MNRRELLKLASVGLTATAGIQTTPIAEAADKPKQQEILMLLYPQFTALDLVGPHHVLSMLGPNIKLRLVWKNQQEVVSDLGLSIRPTTTFAESTEEPLAIFVPGGTEGTLAAMEDKEVRDFLGSRAEKTKYVTSVCTGSLVLAAAGLLKGYKATTHWLTLDTLKKFGAEPVAERVVVDRNRITGGGVTAGIDFALTLAAKLKDDNYAQAVQLMMEYDPQPPFKSGNPKVASKENVEMLRAMTVPFQAKLDAAAKRLSK